MSYHHQRCAEQKPENPHGAGQPQGQLQPVEYGAGADELLITTITHGHADRVRSYALLAEEWRRR